VAAGHDHLVQWLSKRLGQSLKLPQLAGLGYELVGLAMLLTIRPPVFLLG